MQNQQVSQIISLDIGYASSKHNETEERIMKYRIMWKNTNTSVWNTRETDNENEALTFYKELACTQKEIWVKRRIGYSILKV